MELMLRQNLLESFFISGNIDFSFADKAKGLLSDGKVSESDLRTLVPDNTPNTFKPSETIEKGYKYNFQVDERKVEIKWHSPDLNAKELYPDSNSGNMWTAQIKIGKKLLGQDGNFYRKPSNLTHIPIE